MKQWVCEWHNEQAAEIVATSPETCRVLVCLKCGCKMWHANVEREDNHERDTTILGSSGWDV